MISSLTIHVSNKMCWTGEHNVDLWVNLRLSVSKKLNYKVKLTSIAVQKIVMCTGIFVIKAAFIA